MTEHTSTQATAAVAVAGAALLLQEEQVLQLRREGSVVVCVAAAKRGRGEELACVGRVHEGGQGRRCRGGSGGSGGGNGGWCKGLARCACEPREEMRLLQLRQRIHATTHATTTTHANAGQVWQRGRGGRRVRWGRHAAHVRLEERERVLWVQRGSLGRHGTHRGCW